MMHEKLFGDQFRCRADKSLYTNPSQGFNVGPVFGRLLANASSLLEEIAFF